MIPNRPLSGARMQKKFQVGFGDEISLFSRIMLLMLLLMLLLLSLWPFFFITMMIMIVMN